MPLDKDQIADLKKVISDAKRKDLNFGVCLGSPAEETVLLAHATKGTSTLVTDAKRQCKKSRKLSACGTMKVEAQTLRLTCAEEPPSSLARDLRKLLSNVLGMALKVKVFDTDGTLLQSGDDEANWAKIERILSPRVKGLAQSGHPKAGKVSAAWTAALKAAKSGDFAAALRVAAKLKPLLDGAAAGAGQRVPSAAAQEAAAVVPKGTVEKRAFMVDRWAKVSVELAVGIKALAAAIPDIAPWEDARNVSRLVATRLNEIVETMRSEVAASFDRDINDGNGSYAATRRTIARQRASIDADPLLSELKKGVVVPGKSFVGAFEGALKEIDTVLGA